MPWLRLQPIAHADVHDLQRHWTKPELLRYLWDRKTIDETQTADIIRASSDLFNRDAVGLWSLPDGRGSIGLPTIVTHTRARRIQPLKLTLGNSWL
jgi:hypothetical protein